METFNLQFVTLQLRTWCDFELAERGWLMLSGCFGLYIIALFKNVLAPSFFWDGENFYFRSVDFLGHLPGRLHFAEATINEL